LVSGYRALFYANQLQLATRGETNPQLMEA